MAPGPNAAQRAALHVENSAGAITENNILIDGEDVGGSVSRTLRLNVDTGRVMLKTRDGETEL